MIINSQLGGKTPTGTKSITVNGVYDVTNYASADVNVPTTAPAYYIEKTKDASGVAQNGSHLMDFSTFTDVGSYVFAYAYYGNTNITGTPDFSSITKINIISSCQSMFYGCTGITGVNLSSLTTVGGNYACSAMFQNCTGITGTIDLSSLTTISGVNGCQHMFHGCTGITGAIDLSSLTSVNSYGCDNMFNGCTGITSIDLSGLEVVNTSNAFSYAFQGCSGITSVDLSNLSMCSGSSCFSNTFNSCINLTSISFPKLVKIEGGFSSTFAGCTSLTNANFGSLVGLNSNSAMGSAFFNCTNLSNVNISHLTKLVGSALGSTFRNCTSLTELSFNGLAYTATNINNAFSNTLQGCSNVTVHFPAEWQTAMAGYSNITNGLGGTNTTVLFDLPNVTTMDLSYITEIKMDYELQSFGQSGYFANITSVNLSGLTSVSGNSSCSNMFYATPNITSITLSALKNVSGYSCCSSMFSGCTGITGAIDLSSLENVSGQRSCANMFNGCTGITSVDLSGLVSVGNDGNVFDMGFYNCTSLLNINLSSLKTIGTSGLTSLLNGCSSITTVSFPALQSVAGTASFQSMLQNTSGVTVHFPSNFSTIIYPNTLGGTGTTVLYDLPAVVVLTGADTKEYERNPKYDTATALAWRINGTMPNTTTYYTSGLTDPTVGTTIYSDSACTTAETTVSSIA